MKVKMPISAYDGMSLRIYNSIVNPSPSPREYGERLARKNHRKNKGGKRK